MSILFCSYDNACEGDIIHANKPVWAYCSISLIFWVSHLKCFHVDFNEKWKDLGVFSSHPISRTLHHSSSAFASILTPATPVIKRADVPRMKNIKLNENTEAHYRGNNTTLLLQIHWHIREPEAQIRRIMTPGGPCTKTSALAAKEFGDLKKITRDWQTSLYSLALPTAFPTFPHCTCFLWDCPGRVSNGNSVF